MKSSIERLRTWDSRSQAHTSSDRNLRQALNEMSKLKDKLAQFDDDLGDSSGSAYLIAYKTCPNELACNYNSLADSDDGGCEYSCYNNYSLEFNGIDQYHGLFFYCLKPNVVSLPF